MRYTQEGTSVPYRVGDTHAQREPSENEAFGRWLDTVCVEYQVSTYGLAQSYAEASTGKSVPVANLPRANMREYRRGKRKPNGPAAFWLGESLRACGVPWSSGTVALYVCGYESVRWDILEAITRRDTARGAWLWLGHQVEKYIIDELDVADLVLPPFAMLANCWQMIGSEALKWAWGETRTEGFRRRGLAETVRFVLNQKDLTVELRRDIVRDIGRLWAKHHRLEAYTKLFRETIEASEDMSSASR